MTTRRILALLGAFLAAALFARAALAHPHVWIDARIEAWFVKGAVTELRITWVFDDFFSAMAVEDFDANKDKKLDAAELRKLATVSEETLAESRFFLHVDIDGAPLVVQSVKDMVATLSDKGLLRYTFTVPLPEPVDPSRRDLSVAMYDENYYIDVILNKTDPVLLRGETPLSCHFAVAEDRAQSFYMGLIHPVRARIQCVRG